MEDTTRRRILDLAAWTAGVLAIMVLLAHEATAGGKLRDAGQNERWQVRMRQLPYRLFRPRFSSAGRIGAG
jgi:hypothetical protein